MTRDHQGMGLGLYAASRVVSRLGGTLTLAPADDGPGTAATVTLPVSLTATLEPTGHEDAHDVAAAVEPSPRSGR